MKPSAKPMGMQRRAAINEEARAASGLLVAEIAWMMNCVEKIAPAVPMIHAPIVPPGRAPDHVKKCAGMFAAIGLIPPDNYQAIATRMPIPTSLTAL